MSNNYYGCMGRHAEHTCLSYYYHNRKFKFDRWCDVCQSRFNNLKESHNA